MAGVELVLWSRSRVYRLLAPRPQAGYPVANTLPSALGQQLGSLRGRGQVGHPQAVGSWWQVVKTTMTPDGCVLWEAGRPFTCLFPLRGAARQAGA